MATLVSKTFTRDPKVKNRLQQCADSHAFNIHQRHDAVGDHVSAIHAALVAIVPNHGIAPGDLENGVYGPTTAAAVAKFKDDPALNGTGKKILGPGQVKVDNIVGIQTVAALDERMQKLQPGPDVPPAPIPVPGKFTFRDLKAPLLIKSGSDDPNNQDLENAPVQRLLAATKARVLLGPKDVSGSVDASEAACKKRLLGLISRGGPHAREMAEFFINNQQRPPQFMREFSGDHFWVETVKKDKSFTRNHANLSKAIADALQELADGSPLASKVVDINKLQDGSSFQPASFAGFANDIDFSFQRDLSRLASGDPLAFGIGSIQGLQVRITSFTGNGDGSFKGKLQYVLIDHFGSNDSDVIDPGQASLWLLQRKMTDGQGRQGCEPYRVKIIVNDVEFSGQLK